MQGLNENGQASSGRQAGTALLVGAVWGRRVRTGCGVLLMLLALGMVSPLRAETTTYYVTNAQGTVVAEMDSGSNVTYDATYRPYGQQQNGLPQAGPGYTGHVNDPDTGLVYMQARYYDPVVGRFLSVDPDRDAEGNVYNFNAYAYVENNPVFNIDPTGMDPINTDSTLDMSNEEMGGSAFIRLGGGSGGKEQGGSDGNTQNVISYVSAVVRHFTMSDDTTHTWHKSALPNETANALYKFFKSPVGEKIYKAAINNRVKINLILVSYLTFHEFGGNNIFYTLNIQDFLKTPNGGELHDATLDILLGHEFGHTRIASEELGYPYSQGFSWSNEFNVIRYVENPYRAFIHAPLRTTYGHYPVPPPLMVK